MTDEEKYHISEIILTDPKTGETFTISSSNFVKLPLYAPKLTWDDLYSMPFDKAMDYLRWCLRQDDRQKFMRKEQPYEFIRRKRK